MANENKTHAEIVSEMRRHGQYNIDEERDKPVYGILTAEGKIIKDFADLLEAAHKREMDALKQRCAELDAEVAAKDEVIKRLNDAIAEDQRRKMATAENSSAVGSAAKLREALVHIKDRLPHMLQYMRVHWEDASAGGYFDELMLVIDAALAAPPRNCDVGTADEQAERYGRYCDKFTSDGMHCETCPCCGKIQFGKCEFVWAQMPYEEGGAK